MKIALLIFCVILGISFSGCTDCPEPKEPEVIVKTEFIKRPLATISEKPKFVPYQMIMVNFNGDDYYAIPRVDGNILKTNWLQYQDWAVGNYKMLKDIENEDSNSTKK